MKTDKEGVIQLAQEQFCAEPEYLWARTPDAAVFRHQSNQKWFAVIMQVSGRRLGLDTDEMVDILDVKCDPRLLGSFLEKPGCLPAYHMNKQHWLTVLLDGSVPLEEVRLLMGMSYDLTETKLKKGRRKIT